MTSNDQVISNDLNGLFKVAVVVADFIGSIQMEAQRVSRSRLFVTWRLRAEVGH